MNDKANKINHSSGSAGGLSNNTIAAPAIIHARLVQKHFFTTLSSQDERFLYKCGLTFMDAQGKIIDLDIWSRNGNSKPHYLYRKLRTNEVYKLDNCTRFGPTNKKFTNAQLSLANVRQIWIEPSELKFKPTSYLPCTTSCIDAEIAIKGGETPNILATFIARHRGPRKFLSGFNSAIAVAHLVELEDKDSIRFFVLLWQPRNIKAPYYLMGYEPGEKIIIPNCRAYNRHPSQSRFTIDENAPHFTSLCHAVSNPIAVSPEKLRELDGGRNKQHGKQTRSTDNRSRTSNVRPWENNIML